MPTPEILKGVSIFVGSIDLSGHTNQLGFQVQSPAQDFTTFASGGWKECLPGQKECSFDFQGFWEAAASALAAEAGTLDYELATRMAAVNLVAIVKRYPAEVGDVAYFANALETSYQQGGQVGAQCRINAQMSGTGVVVRGVVAENLTSDTTHDSAGQSLGATASGKKLYVGVFVFAAAGTDPTLDLVVKSDDDPGFPSPTTRITVPQFTGLGSYFGSVDGPITDTELEVVATIGGTDSPSFTYAVVLGIA